MAAPTFEELTKGIHSITNGLQKSREGGEGLVHSFTELLNKLIPITAAFKGIQLVTGGMFSNWGTALVSLTKTTQELYAHRRLAQESLKDLRVKFQAGELNVRQYRDARIEHTAALHVLRAQMHLSREIDAVGRKAVGLATFMLGMAAKTFDTAIQCNAALLEGNSSFWRRFEMMQSMARVQTATGAAQQTVISATRSLVRYGLESKASFQDNLKTVILLHDAVGLTTDESAHLAAVTENYARASFQRVADVVATLVDQTALAASEVKNLGIELQRALGVVTPGATNLPQVVMALGSYEAALKEVTGRVGSFQKLVSNLATPEGMLQAGMLGVTPDMIRTKEGIDMIMGRFDGLVRRVVGNSEGLNRVWRLDTVAKMMSLSREEVSEMIRAMEIRRNQQIEEVSLQTLYGRQVQNLNQGVSRLASSLSAVLQTGLYPVVAALSWLVNGLATIIQSLLDFKATAVVAVVAVNVTIGVLIRRLWGVWGAFKAVARAVSDATKKLLENAAAQVAQARASGVSTAAVGGGSLVKIVGYLASRANVIIAILTGVATALYWIMKWNKQAAEDSTRMTQSLTSQYQTLENKARIQMYAKARRGDTEGAFRSYEEVLNAVKLDALNRGLSTLEIADRFEKAREQSGIDLTRAEYTPIITGERELNAAEWNRKKDERDARLIEETIKMRQQIAAGVTSDQNTRSDFKDYYENYWDFARLYWSRMLWSGSTSPYLMERF